MFIGGLHVELRGRNSNCPVRGVVVVAVVCAVQGKVRFKFFGTPHDEFTSPFKFGDERGLYEILGLERR